MGLGSDLPAGHERVDIGVGSHLGAIEEQLGSPHQPGLLAQLDHVGEEALEQGQAESGIESPKVV